MKTNTPNQDSEQLFREALEQDNVDKQDGLYALEFVQKYNTLKSNSRGSTVKYFYVLKAFLKRMKEQGVTLRAMKENDAYELFNGLKTSQWSEDSRFNYWKAFIRFYKWTAKRYGQEWDETVKGLMYANDPTERLQYKVDKNRVEKKSTFTPEQVIELATAETNLCYKVLFTVLFDSGMRGGEAFSIKLKDVEKKNPDVFVLHMERSKTRIRPVVLERGTSIGLTYLERWLTVHPRKEDPEEPLFCNTLGETLAAPAANKRLKVLVEEVTRSQTDPDKKKVWQGKTKVCLHSMRHSRATDLANRGMSGELMATLVGWTHGSRMPATYIRSAQLDAQAALRRAYGIEKYEEKKVQGKTCLSCHTINPADAERCGMCHLPLNPEEVSKLMQAYTQQQAMNAAMENMAAQLHKKLILQLADMINSSKVDEKKISAE